MPKETVRERILRTIASGKRPKCSICRKKMADSDIQMTQSGPMMRCKACAAGSVATCMSCGETKRILAFTRHGDPKKYQECAACHGAKHGKGERTRLEAVTRGANTKAAAVGATGTLTVGQVEGRIALFGRRCWVCGSQERLGVDHVKPFSAGGSNLAANIRPCCRSCNASKGALDRVKLETRAVNPISMRRKIL